MFSAESKLFAVRIRGEAPSSAIFVGWVAETLAHEQSRDTTIKIPIRKTKMKTVTYLTKKTWRKRKKILRMKRGRWTATKKRK